MLKIMYTNFESLGSELLPQLCRNPITSFGNKIKRGAKSKLYLQLRKRTAFCQTCSALHIVGQHKCKFLAIRPPWPVCGWTLGPWHDRPYVTDAVTQAQSQLSPNRRPDRPVERTALGRNKFYCVAPKLDWLSSGSAIDPRRNTGTCFINHH